ncbi:nucleoside-diphosphate kinase [Candidatus Dojkabacteria bacterium]|uniref:nucleoside-diphosphate kinase n=1 Tax=Candidatus Dojkabacteria bacterium TaxID=2099670 RepID=A0A955L9S2_9BACT|nr:nucleoside-diphosphate kinase [Candidatus Dojkabacteria bacterium]
MDKKKSVNYERTLVLVKPDGVQRGLTGEILSRFERKGLKIVAMKMVWPTAKQAKEHYFWSDEEKRGNGERTIAAYAERGIEIKEDPIKLAEKTQAKLFQYLEAGPIVAFVIEGAHAIAHVRKLVGSGNPLQADVGTIRADFTIDSYILADEDERITRNLIHASGNVSEAEREMKVWFTEKEMVDYDLAIEKILYDTEWEKVRGDLTKKD